GPYSSALAVVALVEADRRVLAVERLVRRRDGLCARRRDCREAGGVVDAAALRAAAFALGVAVDGIAVDGAAEHLQGHTLSLVADPAAAELRVVVVDVARVERDVRRVAPDTPAAVGDRHVLENARV